MSTLVSPYLSLERDILLKVNCFVDKHCKWLVFEEEVFFLGAKNTAGVRVLAGSEVVGFNSASATTC
jgi:hypothetical protein